MCGVNYHYVMYFHVAMMRELMCIQMFRAGSRQPEEYFKVADNDYVYYKAYENSKEYSIPHNIHVLYTWYRIVLSAFSRKGIYPILYPAPLHQYTKSLASHARLSC